MPKLLSLIMSSSDDKSKVFLLDDGTYLVQRGDKEFIVNNMTDVVVARGKRGTLVTETASKKRIAAYESIRKFVADSKKPLPSVEKDTFLKCEGFNGKCILS